MAVGDLYCVIVFPLGELGTFALSKWPTLWWGTCVILNKKLFTWSYKWNFNQTLSTVGARILNRFGIRMVHRGSVFEWFRFWMVALAWVILYIIFHFLIYIKWPRLKRPFWCSVFKWLVFKPLLHKFGTSKTFCFRMDSEFECSVFEPPLYLCPLKKLILSGLIAWRHLWVVQK